jgi:hypothetical protein
MGLIGDLIKDTKTWALEQIQAAQASISLMAQIREQYGEDWQIEELTRVIMYDEAQFIEAMRKEAERASAAR